MVREVWVQCGGAPYEVTYQCKYDALPVAQVLKKLKAIFLNFHYEIFVTLVVIEKVSAFYTFDNSRFKGPDSNRFLVSLLAGGNFGPDPVQQGGLLDSEVKTVPISVQSRGQFALGSFLLPALPMGSLEPESLCPVRANEGKCDFLPGSYLTFSLTRNRPDSLRVP